MSSDALYERDPEAWNALLAEGNAKQARKRVSADVLLRDSRGHILLVDPKYKPDWDLPGGMAEANEPPAEAVRRELREELGLEVQVGELLCVDWVSPHGPWDDLVNFIFDGGALDERTIAGLRLVDDELRAFEFCDEGQVKERLRALRLASGQCRARSAGDWQGAVFAGRVWGVNGSHASCQAQEMPSVEALGRVVERLRRLLASVRAKCFQHY